MTRKINVGIKDIGRAVGVSMMTVSRALRGVEGVSPAMRAEILRMAEVMDYRPNRTARSLASARSSLIGISIPTLFSDVFPEILDGMRATLSHAGFDTVIDTTDYDRSREAAWVERMLDWNAAGLVLSGIDHAPEMRDHLRALQIPTLEIWDVCDDPIDICVGVDHHAAGEMLGRHLIACSYRRPAFVSVPEGRDRRADKRLAGLRASFEAAGVAEMMVERVDRRAAFVAGAVGTEALLNRPGPRPDVIAYLNDHMAFGGLSVCERLALPVPQAVGPAAADHDRSDPTQRHGRDRCSQPRRPNERRGRCTFDHNANPVAGRRYDLGGRRIGCVTGRTTRSCWPATPSERR